MNTFRNCPSPSVRPFPTIVLWRGGRHTGLRPTAVPGADERPAPHLRHDLPEPERRAAGRRGGGPGEGRQVPPEPLGTARPSLEGHHNNSSRTSSRATSLRMVNQSMMPSGGYATLHSSHQVRYALSCAVHSRTDSHLPSSLSLADPFKSILQILPFSSTPTRWLETRQAEGRRERSEQRSRPHTAARSAELSLTRAPLGLLDFHALLGGGCLNTPTSNSAPGPRSDTG